jgi:hypothetical protein
VADGHGGSATASFSWDVSDTPQPPTVTSPGNQTSAAGQSVSLTVNATPSSDGDPLSYSATGLPSGLDIDDATGVISGTIDPAAAAVAPCVVTVTASDSNGTSTSQTFDWTVTGADVAPQLTSPGNQTNAAEDAVSLALSATHPTNTTLTYTASGLPAGLGIDPSSGAISGTLAASAASSTPYNVTVIASGGTLSSSQTFTWAVAYVGLTSPGYQANLDGDAVSLPLTATDANGLSLTYSATALPPGLSINGSTGLISDMVVSSTADLSNPYAFTLTASDGTHSASQSFNWSVARLGLDSPGNQVSREGSSVSLSVAATDNVGTPSYTATGLPAGLSINASTGLITGTVGPASAGSDPFQVTVTATDGSASVSESFPWTVSPFVALLSPGPQTSAAGDSVSVPLAAGVRAAR